MKINKYNRVYSEEKNIFLSLSIWSMQTSMHTSVHKGLNQILSQSSHFTDIRVVGYKFCTTLASPLELCKVLICGIKKVKNKA